MENTLAKLIGKEKRKVVFQSIIAAVLISGLVLAISFGLNNPTDDPVDTDKTGDNPNNQQSYVLSLNNELETKFAADEISGFYLHGNATNSVYPGLLEGYIRPITSSSAWNVSGKIVEDVVNDPMNFTEYTFDLSESEINQLHLGFLSSLSNTEEVSKSDFPDDVSSVPKLLHYNVLYDDNTGLSFTWLGFDTIDILEVQNFTWTGTPLDFNTTPVDDTHYLSPLSAFDSWISLLQQLYSSNLD